MKGLFTFALMACLGVSVAAQQATDEVSPEQDVSAGAGFAEISPDVAEALAAKQAGRPVEAESWMVTAANPHAVQAGAEVLRAGGTAADAMVAVQAVLGLVEPQSSGIGGGAFLVWHDGETGEITTLDGRETAPLAATPQLFQDENGEPMGFWDAVIGGRSVGVPGTPALMEAAHDRWGRAEWPSLFDPAIRLADEGFPVSERLSQLVLVNVPVLARYGPTSEYFLPNDAPLIEGQTLKNPEYAEVMRRMAAEGASVIYEGEIAQDIVETVQDYDANPGVMTVNDLAIYEVKERPAVCVEYRAHEVCGMGPPSSGALTVGQILGMLDSFGPGAPDDPQTWQRIGDASRLAFADRGRYMADRDHVPMPTEGLVDPSYLQERARLLEGDDALPEVAPGDPGWDHAMLWSDDESLELPSTSHISIVDSYGNALSMTTTIENGFGSRLMTNGFLLNNELTDFSFRTHADGRPIANAVAPGKRPRSSMSPTIVRKDGDPVLVIGSPGGSRIIGYVAQSIIAHIDWGMDVQEAVAMPRAVNRFGTFDLESGTDLAAFADDLEALGYEVDMRDLSSGLHAISVGPQGLTGGADPRREGIALGE